MKEYAKGNIVVATFDGIQAMPLKEFVKQPADGMLYDLNRNEAVVLTFIKDPKWINDYAVSKVIQELKRQLDEDDSVHIEKLLNDYKKEELKDCEKPFHHEAEVVAGFKYFIEWLKRKENK